MRMFVLIMFIVAAVMALFWPVLHRLGLGRLPGDIVINRPGAKIYIPITSAMVLFVIISILLKVLRH